MHLSTGTLLQGGKYKIEKKLGQGGFGITYLATQVLLGRKVCIMEYFFMQFCKRDATTNNVALNGEYIVHSYMQKFIQTARMVSQLEHRNIIRIRDIFTENNTAYYVMEYHSGGSLGDLVKSRGVLPEADAVRYIRQIAEAVGYIHKHKICHLNIKPGNILLNSEGVSVLIDFVISKQYDDNGFEMDDTPVGISHGYAPMEQYNYDGVSTFSPQSDIYSLGATLYKLVTGAKPPQANEILNDGLPELPAHLSARVRKAIEQAMQPRKKDRPGTVEEFIALLPSEADTVTITKEEAKAIVQDKESLAQHLSAGTLLQGGKYKIEKKLGQGGFGITYLATQVLLDRQVCIKEFFYKQYCERDATTSNVTLGTKSSREIVDKFMKKFIKEAITISKLDHRNIIRIHDIFTENNTAYYVMEYHSGGSLGDLVKSRGMLPEADAVRYITQIAEAVGYIHERNINHLDIKPANILLNNEGASVLIDFGLSKQYDAQGDQTSSTPVGISHGYAPMEQYNPGGVSTFSPQSDIYSLGATLYKLVTGDTPPKAMDIIDDDLPALPAHLSAGVKKTIEQAMQPRKKERPATVKDFLALLSFAVAPEKKSDPEITVTIEPENDSCLWQLPAGTLLQNGKYKIERVLAYDMYEITYLATQVLARRKVCIKELFLCEFCKRSKSCFDVNPDGARKFVDDVTLKFIDEAYTIMLLNHPNFIRIYDIFTENNTAYYVREYYDRGSLNEFVKAGKALPETVAVGYIRQIADAVRYINQRQISHDAINPENILLDSRGNCVLNDFSICNLIDDEDYWSTSDEPIPLSAYFIAPEKHSNINKFTPQSDIYSLGATLYALLAGTNPPCIGSILDDGLPALPAHLSDGLKKAVEQAMQLRAKDRPATIDEFLALLSSSAKVDETTMAITEAMEAHSTANDYFYGRNGKPKDYSEAVKWYSKAAELGHTFAQNNLGVCYCNGLGVTKDYFEAVKWYRKAAEQGDMDAQNNLGVCYQKGEGVPQDYSEAVKWYRKAAEQGHARAQCYLGYCYQKGEGVSQDYSEAVKWYRKAAEQGHATAQCNLGYCYESGWGVPQDYSEAVKWYRKAAEQGHARAQNNLGYCYKYGQGVPKDYSEAVKWYRKATEQGHATAQNNLGVCYEKGQGVSQDYSEAVKWYRKAAEQGNEYAKEQLQRLKEMGY